MVLVAGGVCRYSIVADWLGYPAINVIDVAIDNKSLPTDGISRADVVEETGGILLDSWYTKIVPQLGQNYQFRSVDYVDLDTIDGTTGSLTTTDDHTLPENGPRSGEPMSGALAALITKATSSQRGARAGRLFLAGLLEIDVSGNVVVPGTVSALNAAFATFVDDMTETGITPVLNHKLVVVHQRDGVFTNYTDVTSMTASADVTTQVRRLPQR